MYERFSDRARKVMQLANQEAQRNNNEYIAPEHILLGIAKEGSGVACAALCNLDKSLNLSEVRRHVEATHPAGPEMVIMGKLPHTPAAKQVIEQSINAAKGLGHNYVGTEHILLGILAVESPARDFLAANGITACEFEKAVLELLKSNNTAPSISEPLKKAWEVLAASSIVTLPKGVQFVRPREAAILLSDRNVIITAVDVEESAFAEAIRQIQRALIDRQAIVLPVGFSIRFE